MANFAWMAQVAALSPAALTVRAQTISPNDNGRLLWDLFFPRVNVDSVRLSEINTLDDRPAADRGHGAHARRRLRLHPRGLDVDAAARKDAMKQIRSAEWYDAAKPVTVKESPHGRGIFGLGR